MRNLTMREVALESGLVVSSRYRLVARLSRGGMGEVWRATHTALGRDVAIKVLQIDRHSDEALRQFEQEARICAKLRHPNNVHVVDFAASSDIGTMLVMELVDGHPLSVLPLPLPVRRAVDIARQVCSAVGEAHALSLVHRDLKPSNVMVTRVDGRDFVKVLDYGIATFVHDTAEQGRFTGTPLYASPEQCAGTALDDRTDIYSLGVMLYELIAGQPPFARADRETLLYHHRFSDNQPLRSKSAVPPELDDVVTRCLSKTRARRPASMVALRAELDAVLAALPAATDVLESETRAPSTLLESPTTTVVVPTPPSFVPNDGEATSASERLTTIDNDTVATPPQPLERVTISALRAARPSTRRVVYADAVGLVALALAAAGLARTAHTPEDLDATEVAVLRTDVVAPIAVAPGGHTTTAILPDPDSLCRDNGVCDGEAVVIATRAPAQAPEPTSTEAPPAPRPRTRPLTQPASGASELPTGQAAEIPSNSPVLPQSPEPVAPAAEPAGSAPRPTSIDEILGATALRRDGPSAEQRADHAAAVEAVLRNVERRENVADTHP